MSKLRALIYRGNIVESKHAIKCSIYSFEGNKIFSTNNENDLIYPRSSIKIFQAIPFSKSNAINLFDLNKKQVALSCSSHCGESYHLKELKIWLKKTKLKSSDLKCGIHSPLDSDSSKKLFSMKNKPYQLHNNCAGKHLAMLSACLANNYDIEDYVNFNHPHQKKIRKIFNEFSESKISKKNYGIDGCSAPQYSFQMDDIIKALNNLFRSYNGSFYYSELIKIMINSILVNPLYIGGTKNLDSNLIKISNKKIFCKGGAEGVFLFIHLKKGILGVLKVKDGNERVLPSIIYTLFKKFKILNNEELRKFYSWDNFKLLNHAGIKVGHIKTIIE